MEMYRENFHAAKADICVDIFTYKLLNYYSNSPVEIMHRKACVARYLVQAVTTEQCLLHQIFIASDLVV